MSDERLFPRAIAEAAHRHVVKANEYARRHLGSRYVDSELEEMMQQLVDSYAADG